MALLRLELANSSDAPPPYEAFAMCRLLASKHGIFCGPSTGLNVAGAIALAKDMIPGQNIVTLGVDSGLKYLSGSAYSR